MVKVTKLPPGEESPDLQFQQFANDKNFGSRVQKYYSPKSSETARNSFQRQIERLRDVNRRSLRQIIKETDVHDISDAPVESAELVDVPVVE